MASKFSAEVSEWVAATERRMLAVLRELAQRVVGDMQSRVPIDTGFLRASLVPTLNAPVTDVTFRDGVSHAYSPDQVTLVLARWEGNQTFFATYSANYARHVNFGAGGRPARLFRELAVQRWPDIVAEVCIEARSRAA